MSVIHRIHTPYDNDYPSPLGIQPRVPILPRPTRNDREKPNETDCPIRVGRVHREH